MCLARLATRELASAARYEMKIPPSMLARKRFVPAEFRAKDVRPIPTGHAHVIRDDRRTALRLVRQPRVRGGRGPAVERGGERMRAACPGRAAGARRLAWRPTPSARLPGRACSSNSIGRMSRSRGEVQLKRLARRHDGTARMARRGRTAAGRGWRGPLRPPRSVLAAGASRTTGRAAVPLARRTGTIVTSVPYHLRRS